MTMLRVRDVTVRFGGIVALDGVSLDLNRGEILGLIGPNGAGKTTLFNCISGVIRPDAGAMFFEGRSLKFAPPHERARLGIARTFQNLQLWASMTVQENLTVPMDALGGRNTFSDALHLPFSTYAERASAERARAILHVLELDDYARSLAGDLPAGIQRRVEIARALAARPQLLLLDEPAAGLDARETEHLAELLHTVRERFHVSMLLVDHDMSLVLPVSDYVYVLDFGKVLAKGRPSAIQNDPKVIAAYLGEESEKTDEVLSATRRHQEAPLLEVKGLAAGYGHLEVIRDVNLTVCPGEVVACIGANGAGKTTTLRAISGMIHPRSGKVTFSGRDVTGQTSEQISRQGLLHIPEGRGLFPNLSVEDLVMVDEMSQGLAPTVVRQLFDTIRMMRDEGIAVLIVEQFVESALEVADRAYVFEHGTIGHSGSAADLRADRKLISGSYLGTAVASIAGNGNGHHADPALMEIVSVKMPAALKRTLEERAENEGRPTGAVVMELLEKVKR